MFGKTKAAQHVVKEDEKPLTREQLWELIPGLQETDAAVAHQMAYAETTEAMAAVLALMERSEKLVARYQQSKKKEETPIVEAKTKFDWNPIVTECIRGTFTIVGGVSVVFLMGLIGSQGYNDHKIVQTAGNLFRR